ncbi:hypothetical protein ABNQ39_20400 [Azospirillum sp. A26]|uniref:hypothetical protein n=1 Tax=Azospirillum sp. A26 TaxID=3160607 RepID=UPI00366F17FB
MPKPTGLPHGHVPRFAPPADRSPLFGSHTEEAKRLRRAADEADWAGNPDTAKRLYARAEYHRAEAAVSDLMPLF